MTRVGTRVRIASVVGVIGAVTAAATAATATAGSAAASPDVAASSATTIVTLIADRLVLADTVARSKWVTRSAIDDPVREHAVLDAAARTAPPGAPALRVRVVVRDQIEASKTVQRALFAGWSATPRTAPRTDPDLRNVRTRISDLTAEIAAATVRPGTVGGIGCLADLASVTSRVVVDRGLDAVHTIALVQAERSVCSR
ncbi:gamma subclass chorismate mutase AroQ [Williamsia maris]|uniref:chorismate mutase n=1 Tax=Williamsia maris TaxID=72806 RepID=A0ABT1HK44_9NOCA|nr:gamma subclass chorismate mutase AroQ [Williamsia maris]MCP2178293.1 chorismate mutase [Williamsia maris]